jgi:glycosyltransferase involved in cell wall biosynthesis
MKILFVLPHLALGGAERVMIQLANGIIERGHEVEMFIFSATGAMLASEVSPRIHITYALPNKLSLLTQFRAFRKLSARLSRLNYDAVISTLFQTNFLVSYAHKCAKTSAVLILREANYVSTEWRLSRFYIIARLIGPWLYRRADRIVTLSDVQKQDLIKCLSLNKMKVLLIKNPVLGSDIVAKSKEPLSEDIESKLAHPIILGVGRLAYQKGFDLLIKAFADFFAIHSGTLLILGEGSERVSLSKLAAQLGIAEAVIMPGTDLNPYKYMRHSDMFVLSSRYEGLPNVLIQALAMGAKCIATDCLSGPREVLDGGRFGLLVPVDDVESLAKAMSYMMVSIPSIPPEDILEQYSQASIVDAYLLAIGSVINGRAMTA